MDWDKAIERNGMALLRIVAALFALLVSARLGSSGLMVPRHVWHAISLVLRPAEAAVRRLIVIAARELVSAPFAARSRTASFIPFTPNPVPLAPLFNLFDPLKTFSPSERGGQGGTGSSLREPPDDAPVNAEPLFVRLRALRHALADLPKQAKRLARFNARRDAQLKAGWPVRMSLLRPGLPPGWHARPKHEVDTVLRECHALVRYLDDPPNTT